MPPGNETAKGRRVGMVVFSYYPADPRVRREGEALVKAGMSVDVVCLKRPEDKTRETIDGVEVYRLPVVRKRGSPLRYLWEYVAFFFLSFLRITSLHFRRAYHVVHVHNMPDFLVFTALVPKFSGARVVLDLHDPMPEVFISKYDLPPSHLLIRMLRAVEKVSIRFADLILTPNLAFKRLFVGRGCPQDKVHIIMNSPDPAIFHAPENHQPQSPGEDGTFVLMYHGTIVERHGLETALEALQKLRGKITGLRFDVYGEGDYVDGFKERTAALHLEDIVRYHGQVSLETISRKIDGIDIGIIPNKRSVFTEINLPTRIFEYLSKGKTVVVPETSGIQDYFDDTSIHFFDPGDAASLAQTILRIYEQPDYSKQVLERGLSVYHKHSWELEKVRLTELVRSL